MGKILGEKEVTWEYFLYESNRMLQNFVQQTNLELRLNWSDFSVFVIVPAYSEISFYFNDITPKKVEFLYKWADKSRVLMHLKHIFLNPEADAASGHCFKVFPYFQFWWILFPLT